MSQRAGPSPSFKGMAPGLRLAYLVVPRELVPAFLAVQDSLSCYAPLTHQHLVADFMASGELASHIRRTRALYRDRAAALMAALEDRVGDLFAVPELEAARKTLKDAIKKARRGSDEQQRQAAEILRRAAAEVVALGDDDIDL